LYRGFVDYENVGSLEGIDVKSYERLLIFCGPKNSKLKCNFSLSSGSRRTNDLGQRRNSVHPRQPVVQVVPERDAQFAQVFFRLVKVSRQRRPSSLRVDPRGWRRLT
jgi:hypothetical protein